MMNFKDINSSILNSTDVQKSLIRDHKFYDYLLRNNVAYFYSKYLSKDKTIMDKQIIAVGKTFNIKFLKTLRLINKLCLRSKVEYLLFKTYKYIPEVVDGDIDIFIKEKDFDRFLQVIKKEGFKCNEVEKLNAVLYKEGFCNIEPRVTSSFHGIIVLSENKIWEKKELVKIGGVKLFKATKEIDVLHLLLSILYRPDYLKLYLFLVCKSTEIKNVFDLIKDNTMKRDLNYIITNLLMDNTKEKQFPLFLGNIKYTIWWFERILPNQSMSLPNKLKQLIFFFYSKYKHIIFNDLVFRHNWPLNIK